MGFFDRYRTRKLESLRITTDQDDEQGLSYEPVSDIYSEIGDLLNMNEINKFRLLKTERNEKYNSFDLMKQDSRVSSILNMYADDCTQFNQSSNVIWAESANADIADFANRIIKNLQLNKHAWNHVHHLCTYGDLYLELFYENEKITNVAYTRPQGSRLKEHIEMVRNPAGVFDLVKQSKTKAFVKVNSVNENYDTVSNKLMVNTYNYGHNETDLVCPPDKFIHISINSDDTRFPNRYILKNTETDEDEIYDVKEGTSILNNVFKVWSELCLLEDSVLLNRLSKSAIIRLIQVEVGNSQGNSVDQILKTLRDKISRTRYLDKSNGNYKNQANPGPLENIIYNATHNGKGAITHDTIGGDVDVKALADIEHFLEKFAQGFPVPLAYVQMKNDDGGGLSAGTSLTKFDARYGRNLKRIQNAYINGITDLINIYAYQRGLTEYINEFTIKMVSPSAVEDNERDEKLKSHTEMIRDLKDILNDEYDDLTKKKITMYLIQTLLQDNGLNDILQEDLQKTEEENESVPQEVQEDNIIDNTGDEV